MKQSPNVILILLVVAMLIAHAPSLYEYGTGLWTRTHYRCLPLALLCAALLPRALMSGAGRVRPGRPAVWQALVALEVVALAYGVHSGHDWVAACGAVGLAVIASYAIGGSRTSRRVGPTFLVLAFLIRPPRGWDERVFGKLRDFVVEWSSVALDAFGKLHWVVDDGLVIADRRLPVDRICGGLDLTLAAISVSILFVAWNGRSKLWSVAVVTSTVPWVLIVTWLGATGLALVPDRWGIRIERNSHYALFVGLSFVIVLAMVLSTDRMVAAIQSLKVEEMEEEEASVGGFSIEGWPRTTWVAVALACVYIAVGGLHLRG